MIAPDIKVLMRNMDSRYTLVVTAAKRARQLTDGARPLTGFRSDKPVTLAIHEIAEGKVDYYRDDAYLDEAYPGAGSGDGSLPGGNANIFGSFGEPGDYDDGAGRARRVVIHGGAYDDDADDAADTDEAYEDADEADEFDEDADGLYADGDTESRFEPDGHADARAAFDPLTPYGDDDDDDDFAGGDNE